MIIRRDGWNGENFNDRLSKGKKAEAEIAAQLIALGLTLKDATTSEDKHDKIDRYVLVNDAAIAAFPVFAEFAEFAGRFVPVQIKQRNDNYPDFDFELFTDRNGQRQRKGREYLSKSVVLFVRSRGTIAAARMGGLRKVALALYNLNPTAFQEDKTYTQHFPAGHPLVAVAELKRIEDKGRDNEAPFFKTILYFKRSK